MDSQTVPSYEDIIHKDILDLMGAGDLSPDHKAELYETMAKTVQNRAALRIADELNRHDREEFRQIVEHGDSAKIQQFLTQRGFDVPRLLLEEAVIYKAEMVKLSEGLPAQ